MRVLIGTVAALTALTFGQTGSKRVMHDASAETYEHLATVIIEIRETENSLVQGILMHYHAIAQRELEAAAGSEAAERAQHVESAAEEVANIANEGDKRVQAVRQRLLKAGHHHHTDKETSEDFMFIDSREKQALLALAGKIGKLASGGSKAEISQIAKELAGLFDQAMKIE